MRAILTLNPRDFKALHDQDAAHAGVLAIYQDNDPTRDMRYADIVRAIANPERSVPQIASGFWILNAYRWSRSCTPTSPEDSLWKVHPDHHIPTPDGPRFLDGQIRDRRGGIRVLHFHPPHPCAFGCAAGIRRSSRTPP